MKNYITDKDISLPEYEGFLQEDPIQTNAVKTEEN